MYPLLFEPTLKNYIWGGRTLETKLGRKLPAENNIAESWEIAAHPDGESTVSNGEWAGLTLTQLHQQMGIALVGTRNDWAQAREKFPLLVKLLDAHRPLSVQVHPNDQYALAHEGNELGKAEMWYVLYAEPEATIVLGVKKGTTAEQFHRAVAEGVLEPLLHHIPVQAGDFIDVPTGSLHAIMGGICLAEIQQNSNTTYRVYDWNRVDSEGKSRPLHIEKALEVINFDQVEPALNRGTLIEASAGLTRRRMVNNRYFTVEHITLRAGTTFHGVCDGSTLEIWGTINGYATVKGGGTKVHLHAVAFTLLPAQLGNFTIYAESDCELLRAYTDENV